MDHFLKTIGNIDFPSTNEVKPLCTKVVNLKPDEENVNIVSINENSKQNVVCRTCLKSSRKYVSIFSATNLWGLSEMIMACAPVVIKIDDGLPSEICENCLQLLHLSFLFRLRIINITEKFDEISMNQIVICRTCIMPSNKYLSIFSAPTLWGKTIILAKMIMACAPVSIKQGDGRPSKICENCLLLLQLCFLFRLHVIIANENVKEIVRKYVVPTSANFLEPAFSQTNMDQIYSLEYIANSIYTASSSSKTFQAVKLEPLDIKEETKFTPSDDDESQEINDNLLDSALLHHSKNNLHEITQKQCLEAYQQNNLNFNICDNIKLETINYEFQCTLSNKFENLLDMFEVGKEESVERINSKQHVEFVPTIYFKRQITPIKTYSKKKGHIPEHNYSNNRYSSKVHVDKTGSNEYRITTPTDINLVSDAEFDKTKCTYDISSFIPIFSNELSFENYFSTSDSEISNKLNVDDIIIID